MQHAANCCTRRANLDVLIYQALTRRGGDEDLAVATNPPLREEGYFQGGFSGRSLSNSANLAAS